MLSISVCIPCYNHEHYIGHCLNSVLEQEGDWQLEILVGDDCSSDKSREIISEFSSHHPNVVKAVFHPTNLGAGENLRQLIARASGDLIAHLDGDDYWLPGKLRGQVALMQQYPSAIASCCNARVIDKDGGSMGVFNDVVASPFDIDYLVKCGNFLNHSSLLYRREGKQVLLEISGEFIDYRIYVRLASLGSFVYLNQPLMGYRWMVANSMTSTGSDSIYERYLHAIEDASSLGASQAAINLCVRRFCRSIIYSALLPPRPARVWRFYQLLRASTRLRQGRIRLLGCFLMAWIQLPGVALRHIVGAFTREKIFFPTRHHSP